VATSIVQLSAVGLSITTTTTTSLPVLALSPTQFVQNQIIFISLNLNLRSVLYPLDLISSSGHGYVVFVSSCSPHVIFSCGFNCLQCMRANLLSVTVSVVSLASSLNHLIFLVSNVISISSFRLCLSVLVSSFA
jgi:hypothetical protein